jgi:hypothetical protein
MPPRRTLPPGRKRVHTPPQDSVPLPSDSLTVSVTMLGAGQEVGRSCCVIQHRGRTIVCDAGIDPGAHGLPSLPFVDEIDWSTVDVLLITQFVTKPFLKTDSLAERAALTSLRASFSCSAHLDHAGGLAYIMEKVSPPPFFHCCSLSWRIREVLLYRCGWRDFMAFPSKAVSGAKQGVQQLRLPTNLS